LRLIVALASIGVAFSFPARSTPIPSSVRLGNMPADCVFASDVGVLDPDPMPPAPDPSVAEDGNADLDGPQSTSAGTSGGTESGTAQSGNKTTGPNATPHPAPAANVPVDANGNPIPLERIQPQRILGFMPNFRSVSGGSRPHPPGWKYNFTVATHQATDYSTFIFLGLTSLTAEGIDEHPALGKGVDGFYAYTWRGFLDKTDGTYLAAWFLPSLIHEDTRFYALGQGHSILVRELYVISREGVARTYGGHQTPNIAGLGGKVLTQVVSRNYYPTSATTFPVLAEKFGYSVMRDVIFTSIREFYPDAAAHFIREHRKKMAAKAAAGDAAAH
jgi:hypothetical protein